MTVLHTSGSDISLKDWSFLLSSSESLKSSTSIWSNVYFPPFLVPPEMNVSIINHKNQTLSLKWPYTHLRIFVRVLKSFIIADGNFRFNVPISGPNRSGLGSETCVHVSVSALQCCFRLLCWYKIWQGIDITNSGQIYL